MREEQRVNKNLFGSVGPGGFSEGFVCMRTVFCFLKKYFLQRLFTRESNLSFPVLQTQPGSVSRVGRDVKKKESTESVRRRGGRPSVRQA